MIKLFGYVLIPEKELHRLEDIEIHARGLVSELENPVPCCVMKKRHKDKINKLSDKSHLYEK